jgi:predicted aldo/keto reductase-like oxidoreductase
MQYVTDSKSGNELSVLGFGCMRFPRDRDKTEKLIVRAVEEGVNYFDSAYFYGGSEAALGSILHKRGLRPKVYLATKLPHHRCKAYADFDRLFQEQLERLKTSYIDYYMIHNISDLESWRRLCGIGIEEWIAGKKASGLIRQMGFSFHGVQDGFIDLISNYEWDFCLIQYNYLDENNQAGRGGLMKAREKGVMAFVMEPMLGGKLATGLPPKAIKAFRDAGGDRSAASWALRWLWNQPEVGVVLSGMNAMEQLEDNLKAAENAKPGMLTEKERAAYESVISILRESYKTPCTGCNYCMPCPEGVIIPGCLAAYNTSYAMGYVAGLTQYLTGTGANNPQRHGRAIRCVKCGECENKCPQNIEIPKALEAVRKRLDPFWLKAVLFLVQKIMR